MFIALPFSLRVIPTRDNEARLASGRDPGGEPEVCRQQRRGKHPDSGYTCLHSHGRSASECHFLDFDNVVKIQLRHLPYILVPRQLTQNRVNSGTFSLQTYSIQYGVIIPSTRPCIEWYVAVTGFSMLCTHQFDLVPIACVSIGRYAIWQRLVRAA